MPTVGSICGIEFFMFNEKGGGHHKKHFLAIDAEYEANYDIKAGCRLNGKMPHRQEKKF